MNNFSSQLENSQLHKMLSIRLQTKCNCVICFKLFKEEETIICDTCFYNLFKPIVDHWSKRCLPVKIVIEKGHAFAELPSQRFLVTLSCGHHYFSIETHEIKAYCRKCRDHITVKEIKFSIVDYKKCSCGKMFKENHCCGEKSEIIPHKVPFSFRCSVTCFNKPEICNDRVVCSEHFFCIACNKVKEKKDFVQKNSFFICAEHLD